MSARAVSGLSAMALAACASHERGETSPAPPVATVSIEHLLASASAAAPIDAPCDKDDDCGYDPARDRCGADPRFNKQPPIVDQGIVCYCEARACEMLRALPIPCEGDESCAVRGDPRPHPVAANKDFPHERGKVCRDFSISTTCERTNICTMHRHDCGANR